MNSKLSPHAISKRVERHIFKQFRTTGLKIAAPMYLLFNLVDWVYREEHGYFWLTLRVAFAISMYGAFRVLTHKNFRIKYCQHMVCLEQVLACSFLNIMIFQSGGHESLYLVGLILTSLIAINIFKISPLFTIAAATFSYIPTLAIIGYSAGVSHWHVTLLYSFYFVSLSLLAYVYSVQNFKYLIRVAEKEIDMRSELLKYQRSEIIRRQFPQSLRMSIESGKAIPQRKFIANAVVGFADITNSTHLTNQVGLNLDWQIKETFIQDATKIATQHDFVVLTQLGDGFLFLANYEENNNWHFNLISFFEALQNRFENLKSDLLKGHRVDDISIKCGAAMGPTLVGFMGSEQLYFTAIGPEVNLAARLCAKAQAGEFVLSSKIWHILKNIGMPWNSEPAAYADLKGFTGEIGAVIIRNHRTEAVTNCSVCDQPLLLVKTEDGLYDLRCPEGHAKEVERAKKIA